MNIVEQNWDQVLNKMKLEYCSSNISYTTWIAPLTVYEVKDNTVYILVKLKASLEHIQDKYLLPFKVCIAEVTGTEYEVEFVTDSPKVIKEKKESSVQQQFRPRCFPRSCRISGRDLQPSLLIWRCWTWKDPFDALRGTLHFGT